MILAKKPEIDRFLAEPPGDIRCVLIHGRDRSGVHERADKLAARIAVRPDDPFDVSLLTEADIDRDPAKLGDELVQMKAGDVLAVPPHVWRAFRATDGVDAVMIITGAPAVEDDGDIDMEWWPA